MYIGDLANKMDMHLKNDISRALNFGKKSVVRRC